MKLVVTIDTEADDQWARPSPSTVANLASLTRFQDLCDRHHVRPTYLVTSEVAVRLDGCQAVLAAQRDGRAEVGAHLHPWTTAPFRDSPGLREHDERHTMPSELPDGLLRGKLSTLTEEVQRATGDRPTSYRAGRFGMDSRSGAILAELGYVVDTSVTPGIDWSEQLGAHSGSAVPDYRDYGSEPFVFDCGRGGELLEVPVTIVRLSGRHPTYPQSFPARLKGAVARAVPRRNRGDEWSLVWCRPWHGYSEVELRALWDEAARIGLPVVNMMFHSSELMPGGSPYRPTQTDVQDLYQLLDGFFRHVAVCDGIATTLTQFAKESLADAGSLVHRRLPL